MGEYSKLESAAFCEGGLRFETRNDARNHAQALVEKSRRWLSRQHRTCADFYVNGEVGLAVKLYVPPARIVELLLVAVPPNEANLTGPGEREGKQLKVGRVDVQIKRNSVFSRPGEAANGPEKVVPSDVWLAVPDVLFELVGDARALLLDLFVKSIQVLPIREVGITFGIPEFEGCGVERLVEGVPQVVNDIVGDVSEAPGDFVGNAKLVDILPCLRVDLMDWHATATLDEGVVPGLKIRGIFPSAIYE